MKFEKIFYALVSTLVIAVFFFLTYRSNYSFDNSHSSKVKHIYFVDHISSAHRKVIDIFNKRNEGRIYVEAIHLSFEKFSTNERKELLTRFLRTKNDRIDIFSVDQIWVPRFAKWAVPLNYYFPPSVLNQISPAPLQTCFVKDTLVAMPLYFDIASTFVNKNVFNELPNGMQLLKKLEHGITWEELTAISNEVKNRNNFYIFQADDYEGLICLYAEMLESLRAPMVVKGKLNLLTKEALKALQLLVDYTNTLNLSPKEVLQFRENASYRYFIKSNGLFLRGWPSLLKNKEIISDSIAQSGKYILAPTPYFRNGKPASIFGGWNLMLSKYSEHQKESIEFINWLISEEAQKIMFEEGFFLPVNKAVFLDTEFTARYKELGTIASFLPLGVHRPFLEHYPIISDVLSFYLHKAIKGEISPADALSKATRQIESGSILLK